MNRIFIAILFGFSAGVAIRSFCDFGWSFAFLFVFLGAIIAGISGFLQVRKFIFLAGLFLFALGFGILRYDIKETRSAAFEDKIGLKINFVGTIIDESDEKDNYTRLVAEEDKTKIKILVINRRYPIFHYGDIVEVSGKLEKPEKMSEFDWPAYLAKEDIYYEMAYPQIKILEGKGGSQLKRWLFSAKEKFIANVSAVIPEPNAGFLVGLTVGAKQAMPKELLEDFRRVGVIHIVVLSGYNITIVSDTIMRLLKIFPQFLGIGFGALGIILFTLMTGASATAVRASIMAGIALLARTTGRIYSITIALLAAGFLMILHNPKILRFDASFQLSFLATLALIYLCPYVEKYLGFIPRKFQLRSITAATISTQIFVLPFLLHKMGLFSVVGLPVNLLILIFVPLTMLFGFLSGGIGFISQVLSVPFSWISHILTAYELWIVNVFSKLPFAALNISISFWLMIIIYAGYAIVLYKMNKNRQNVSLD